MARSTLGEKISTNVVISLVDPENTVLLKDAVDRAIISEFHASLVDRAHSDTHLELQMSEPSYTPVVYDANGYVTSYRMNILLFITRLHNGTSKKYTAKGNYDFEIAPNAIITDNDRFEAIRFSVAKAIRAFMAQVSATGARSEQ